jgi:cation transport regulator ChaB
MPYQKKDELPDAVKALPQHGQEIWMAAFNSAWEQYKGDEEKCFATAWAAVHQKYKKVGDEWMQLEQSDDGVWIEAWASGNHPSCSGSKKEWTDSDLQYIASTYDPKKHIAPIVIGHPEHDSPAFGWVSAAKKVGDKLLLKLVQVADQLKEKVRKGEYKTVSIGLFPDLTLRHLGFLGAAIPAVKGLKQVSFSEKAEWTIESEFFCEAWQQETVKSIFQRMRDWIIDKFSLEEADKIISSYDIEALRYAPKESPVVTQSFSSDINNKGGNDMREWITKMREAIGLAEKELTPDPSIKFSEADIQAAETRGKDSQFAEMEKLKKEKSDLEKEKAEAAARTKEIETKVRNEGITAFCEGLCKEGKLTPALRKIIEPIMIAVSEISEPIEFSEGVKKSRLDGIKDFLTEIPKVVTFKEVAGGDGPNSGGSAAEKLSALTKQKMEAKKDLSYGAAFSEVQKENPELAKELLAEIRPSE